MSDFEDDLELLTNEIAKRYGQDYNVVSATMEQAQARIAAPERLARRSR